ncbi:MAG: hypothetical protein WBE37_12670 [Bryobacteraceae bacterium]
MPNDVADRALLVAQRAKRKIDHHAPLILIENAGLETHHFPLSRPHHPASHLSLLAGSMSPAGSLPEQFAQHLLDPEAGGRDRRAIAVD